MEKPIIFNTEMVRSIILRNKNQTRRPVKPQPDEDGLSRYVGPTKKGLKKGCWYDTNGKGYTPPANPGDVLYVRETFKVYGWDVNDGEFKFQFKWEHPSHKREWVQLNDEDKDGRITEHYMIQSWDDYQKSPIHHVDEDGMYTFDKKNNPCRWRPSIHMPKGASRIRLKVIDVKCKRLQDINSLEARLEGVKPEVVTITSEPSLNSYIKGFASSWDNIYGNWIENPWVWIIEFKVISIRGEIIYKTIRE